MDFSTGNSGNKLFPSVTKIGPDCSQEGSYCDYLGRDVCPAVYAISTEGYTMEVLEPVELNRYLLVSIEELLARRIWNRPALPVSNEIDWKDCLQDYGIKVPRWAIPKEFCLVHGDPTISNCLYKDGALRICDPRPPRNYVPQCKESDMGRILQSYFGWEAAAYDGKFGDLSLIAPDFMRNEEMLDRARFWCGAAVARIQHLQYIRNKNTEDKITLWCKSVRRYCDV